MIDTVQILKAAAERSGLDRERFEERRIPTELSKIIVLPIFGDLDATCILSSIILRGYREQLKGSKYFILCSWPGNSHLFPYVDEYWSIKDKSVLNRLFNNAYGFINKSENYTLIVRSLNNFSFNELIDPVEIQSFYENGISQVYWDKLKEVVGYLPTVPSIASLDMALNRFLTKPNLKVFLCPYTHLRSVKKGEIIHLRVPLSFWEGLVKRLVAEGYSPIVWTNPYSYDLSPIFGDVCAYPNTLNIANILSLMRGSDCVIDIFSGLGKLAALARSPYVALEERNYFYDSKLFEFNDLVAKELPKQYIFSFNTIIESGSKDVWNSNIFNLVISKLRQMLPLDKNLLPSTVEFNDVISYESVRKLKNQRLGTKLIKPYLS